jgi:excisionase family DNA binding protein
MPAKDVETGEEPPSSGALLTVADLAELLQLTVKGVYSMVESRRVPFVRVSNRVRFLRSDVLQWLKENRVPASEE